MNLCLIHNQVDFPAVTCLYITKADFNEMLSSIKVIEQQMDGIKREPADVQKTTSSDNLVQKIRREKRIHFKRKSATSFVTLCMVRSMGDAACAGGIMVECSHTKLPSSNAFP